MSWNYRILAHPQEEEVFLEIHEVFYDGEDESKATTCTVNAVTVGAEDVDGVKWSLEMMAEALDKPILWADDRFPEEYKPE